MSVATTVIAAVLVLFTGWGLLRSPAANPITRFAVAMDEGEELFLSGQGNPPRLAIAPGGRELVYVGVDTGRGRQLWHRSFDRLNARALPGTQGAWMPTFAPDGDRVAFLAEDNGYQLKVLSLTGGRLSPSWIRGSAAPSRGVKVTSCTFWTRTATPCSACWHPVDPSKPLRPSKRSPVSATHGPKCYQEARA